ncbi:MAG: bifunctional tetrahydrofolate synthase/dihydrofolate synthase [Gammaproteobacteria bacterium]|nr:bifunctional tetrahydrofolate synthase/dihydrofolate synthase [Gammaproteobacteria bacterium]
MSTPAHSGIAGRGLSDWLGYIETVHRRSIDMGLDRVRMVLERLVAPWPRFAVISVGGTNGKGSTTAMLDAILRESNYSVGRYTSPHLVHYRERICINGDPVSETELCAAFAEIERMRGDIPLTYFEFSTLAALLLFRERGIDIAVLEVGMGGRLDAVNVMDADVALITNVAIDHVKWLGASRERIAVEKAGIMRPARPVVCVDPLPPHSVLRLAAEVNALLFLLNRDFGFANHGDSWDWWGPGRRLELLPQPNIVGDIQVQNAAGVIMAIDQLQPRCPIPEGAIARGLRSVVIHGRFQVLAGVPEVVLDVAHNAAAAQVLAENLDAHRCVGRTLAVFGVMRDKDIEAIVAKLAARVDRWFVGSIDDQRGANAGEVGRRVCEVLKTLHVAEQVSEHGSVRRAFDAARAAASDQDRILVFGSFHTVGDILGTLK